jgi:hypothetical protein
VTLSSLDPQQTFVRLVQPGLLDRSLQRKGQPRPGRASRVHLSGRRRRAPARSDQLQPQHRLHGAGL